MLHGKRILLIVAGGIAAFKSLELIRRLRERGASVHCVLTEAGAKFVTPLSLQALSEDRVYSDMFSLTDESEMGHIQLSRDADLLVVAPATANILARMAGGLADDLAATVLLATDKPVLAAPAMNVRMWTHAATVANVETLKKRGVTFIGPNDGAMACNEHGPGRMSEPEEIVAAIETMLTAERPLAGKRALVTSGPTREAIDPVRYISNHSSGKQGHAIAAALARLGADVTLVSGPVAVADPSGLRTVHVELADQMLAACLAAGAVDVAVCAAAVADWKAARPANAKIKKKAGAPPPPSSLPPIPTSWRPCRSPGRSVRRWSWALPPRPRTWSANAIDKRNRKGCDWIVANDVSPATGTFGGERNTVHLISEKGVEDWPTLAKDDVALPSGRTHRASSRPAAIGRSCGVTEDDEGRMNGVESVEIEVMRLPHGRDLALPDYATAAAAGADLLAAIDGDIELGPLDRRIVPTGISLALPVGFEAQVRPRSGLAAKNGDHRGQRTGHHRCRLSRRSGRDPDQSQPGAVQDHARHANCTTDHCATRPGGLARSRRTRRDGARRRRLRIDGCRPVTDGSVRRA